MNGGRRSAASSWSHRTERSSSRWSAPFPLALSTAPDLPRRLPSGFRQKIGLVEKPEATVEIIEYPPIYVVGDVTTPGEYRFRDGLTALQALALGGGVFRSPAVRGRSNDEIKLAGELQEIGTDIVRKTAKIARLEAEMSGATDIQFPTVTADGAERQDGCRHIRSRKDHLFRTRERTRSSNEIAH